MRAEPNDLRVAFRRSQRNSYRFWIGDLFHPGGGNGRALTDDAFGTALQFVTGRPIANSASPVTPTPAFPYLAPPHTGELPSLAALFGLRSPDGRPSQAAS
jgi:hypothetical protein